MGERLLGTLEGGFPKFGPERFIPANVSGCVRLTTRRGILAAVGAVALVVAGFALVGVCGGGIALVLFGLATGLVGVVIALQGGYAVLLPVGIMVLILVVAGVYIASVSGCGL